MAGTSWPALTAGLKASASEVELKFDWIEGHIVPMNGGTKANNTYDLGEASYHWRKGYINSIDLGTAQTRYYVIHPADFAITKGTTYGIDAGGFEMSVASGTAFSAVHLPNGASLTSFKIFYHNSSVAANAICELLRTNYTSSTPADYLTIGVANLIATTGTFSVEDTDLTLTSIDNVQYKYTVLFQLGGQITRFNGGLITYEIKGSLPLL